MERITIKNVELEGVIYDKLHVIVDDKGNVILLPLLWTVHLACKSSVHNWRTIGTFKFMSPRHAKQKPDSMEKTFEENSIAENTVDNYVGHFFHFLEHINELHRFKNTPSVHHTELVSSDFITKYLNEVLSQKLQSSESLKAHQAAISAYFSFLLSLKIKGPLSSTIYPRTRQSMAEKDTRPKKINYVSHSERLALLKACANKRDRLILRMGFEVGLRTEENTGLVLSKHRAKLQQQKGLLDLFDELEADPTKLLFKFVLNGKYTKGGKTRDIFFDRDLLEEMKRYYDKERAHIMKSSGRSCDTLFVRNDNEGKGLPISAEHASNMFNGLIQKFPYMDQSLSYHDLRHTFATELYHLKLEHVTGSQNSALDEVAKRLGHSHTTSTQRYVRMQIQMKKIEGML